MTPVTIDGFSYGTRLCMRFFTTYLQSLCAVALLLCATPSISADNTAEHGPAATASPDGVNTSVAAPANSVIVTSEPILPAVPYDLWDRIREGFALEPLDDNKRIASQIAWFAARPDYVERTVDRSRRYLYFIVEEVQRRGIPTEIALLPIVESAFNPHALSRSQASGMWQFIPSTGRLYGLKQDWWYDGRRDVVAATKQHPSN